ncbi:MAG: hypothetical protein M1820_009954 [Bogoriella megaspora]|nr:MAG: hypothetical protein M1820_009954 [Bogoriella megaspora]
MDEEAELPELPINPRPLKRSRITIDDGNISSDPVFSSDGPDPSCEDYAAPGRSKRQYRGPWWDSRRHRRQPFARNKDSGIYMASDTTEDSETSLGLLPDGWDYGGMQLDLSKNLQPRSEELPSLPNQSSQPSIPSSQQLPANEAHAWGIVQHCVESNRELVDLANIELETIPNGMIERLKQIIKVPKASNHRAPSPEHYESLAPRLKLMLSTNSLRSLPPAIFQLEHLTILSLRGNKLTSLPSAIGNLRNLEQLNIAANRLRWFPYELLRLLTSPEGKLKSFNCHPNPLVQPFKCAPPTSKWISFDISSPTPQEEVSIGFQDMSSEKAVYSPWLSHLTKVVILSRRRAYPNGAILDNVLPVPVATSKTAFFNPCGSLSPQSPTAPSLLPLDSNVVAANLCPPDSQSNSEAAGAKSLYEACLKSISSSPYLQDLITTYELPEPITRALQLAKDTQDQMGQNCSRCGRTFIQKRTEWIEYWSWAGTPLFVPFLRQGCSWACVGS